MTTDDLNLAQYEGKRVILTRNLKEANDKGETCVEIEGVAQRANERVVLLKPKGKTNLEMIEAGEIERVQLAPDTSKPLKPKSLRAVVLGAARNHLLERHGFTLTQVNSTSEDEAFRIHEALDHQAADLGHLHKAADEDEGESEDSSDSSQSSDDNEEGTN